MLLHQFFDYFAQVNPNGILADDDNRSLTYGAAKREVQQLVGGFERLGLKPGDRIALLSKNSIDMVIAYLAGSYSGVVPVPLNWRLAPAEWQYIVGQSGAKAIIAQAPFVEQFETIRSSLPELIDALAIDGKFDGWLPYRDWLNEQTPGTHNKDLTPDSILYQMYTSGTTGRPKGALLPHRAILSNAQQAIAAFSRRLVPDDTTLIVMPMFHAGAASFVFGTIISGASMLIQADFDPHIVVEVMESRVSAVNLVPAMIEMILNDVPDAAGRNYSSLKSIIYGASPIAEATLRTAMDTFGCEFYQGYGQTETTAALTFLNHDDHVRALRDRPELLLSAGRPVPGTEIRIVDSTGKDVVPGATGEIIVRGPQIMDGYWKLPEATQSAQIDGWHKTGDAGYLDDEGYLFISDRIKDMIVTGGENVYPREVENALYEHPDIKEAAVIGIPDEKFGEAVMAIIATQPGRQLDADAVTSHCRDLLGGYKVPRRIEFIEELPRNSTGKVMRAELREPWWRGQSRRVG